MINQDALVSGTPMVGLGGESAGQGPAAEPAFAMAVQVPDAQRIAVTFNQQLTAAGGLRSLDGRRG